MKKISVIIGTRPEAIKLFPLIRHLSSIPGIKVSVCATGQHTDMVDSVLNIFNIEKTCQITVDRKLNTLSELTSILMQKLDEYIKNENPDAVIVQGDTTSALCGSLAAFYNMKPVAHVEAGLRTYDRFNPFPEEMNRVLISRLAKWNFCPTENNKENLLKEGIDTNSIFVVGNTVIDALMSSVEKLKTIPEETIDDMIGIQNGFMSRSNKMILVTSHRRENQDGGIDNICKAVKQLSIKYSDIDFVYSVHPNPKVQNTVRSILADADYPNIHLINPQSYLPFIALMNKSSIILTDSGGIQEEALTLNKKLFVLRKTTERQEGLTNGRNSLIGTDTDIIVKSVSEFIESKNLDNVKEENPYGNGHASENIANILIKDII